MHNNNFKLLHENDPIDIKFLFFNLAKYYYLFTGRKEKASYYEEKLAAVSDSEKEFIDHKIEAGNIIYDIDKSRALILYRDAIKFLNENFDSIRFSFSFFRFLKTGLMGLKMAHYMDSNKAFDERMYINTAFNILSYNPENFHLFDGSAHGDIEEEKRPSFLYFIACIFEKVYGTDFVRTKKISAAYYSIKNNENIKVSESKNAVIVSSNPLLNTELIYKSGNLDDLLAEQEMSKQIIDIIKDRDGCISINPLDVINVEGKNYYIMERLSGDTLEKKILHGNSSIDNFNNIAEILGLLHARVVGEFNERDIIENIKTRLSKLFDSSFVDFIVNNLYPLTSSLDNIVRVYNKDAHFGNWIIDENGIVGILDNEKGRKVPIVFDDTNLLDQHTLLSYDEKLNIMRKHWDSYNFNADNISKERFDVSDFPRYELAYLNSSVLRALEVFSQNLSESRSHVRNSVLYNAIKNIGIIKDKFNNYYSNYNENYDNIHYSLLKIDEFSRRLN